MPMQLPGLCPSLAMSCAGSAISADGGLWVWQLQAGGQLTVHTFQVSALKALIILNAAKGFSLTQILFPFFAAPFLN